MRYEIDSADLFDALKAGEKIVVIDARHEEGYDLEHIPNALSLPHTKMNEKSTTALDRGLQYVIYCDGIGCNASTKGALKMSKLGFKVKELIGGLDGWKRDGYSTEGLDPLASDQTLRCYC